MIKKSNQIIINLKSFSFNILKYYLAFFSCLALTKSSVFKMQPIQYKSLTVLRSPHKYKKAQEHFQLKIYKACIILIDVKTPELLVLLTNKPKGVAVKFKVRQVINK